GPRLTNIGDLVTEWFGEKARSVSENLPAVLNVTYSFRARRGGLDFVQYIMPGVQQSVAIEDKFNLKKKILSKVKYSDEANVFIASLINLNKHDGNIIFSDTTTNANFIATEVAKRLDNNGRSQKIDSIKSFIETTVHPKYSLIETIDKGVA